MDGTTPPMQEITVTTEPEGGRGPERDEPFARVRARLDEAIAEAREELGEFAEEAREELKEWEGKLRQEFQAFREKVADFLEEGSDRVRPRKPPQDGEG